MAYFLGVDVGTTKIATLVLDSATGQVISMCQRPNDAEITSAADKANGRSEWDAERAAQQTFECIAEVVSRVDADAIRAVGITGQMHGMVLVSGDGRPVSPFIGWQDQRCQEIVPGRGINYISWIMQLAGLGGFAHTGTPPATGYMGSTLFWLAANGDRRVARNGGAAEAVKACFMADYIVMRLTGSSPVTDPTNAGGSGVFDVTNGQWNRPLIERLGLRPEIFAPVQKSCTEAGGVSEAVSRATGLPKGRPVCVGCGDNQASFAGSVADAPNSLLVNIGTGAQVSAWVPKSLIVPSVDTRAHLDGGFLLVGAPLCGGLSYALLRDFFRLAGESFFGAKGDEDLYDEMNRLARAVPPGADGLTCEPLFVGTRLDPTRRAVWSGMSPANFTPGHFARATLEGVAAQLRHYYADMIENGVKPRNRLICAGNGVRRNPLLSEILSGAFQMPVSVTANTEESAYGAALVAGVGAGEFPTLADAARRVQYL